MNHAEEKITEPLDHQYGQRYAVCMRATVSIPDPVFDAADKLARRLGISRSQLYTTAVSQFIEAHHEEAVTQALNEIYAEGEAEVDPVLRQM